MNLNQAAHGDREFGFVQTRLGVPRKTVAGHVSDPSVAQRVAAWIRAARGLAELRDLRLARFGDNMRDVAVTEGDKVEAQLRFGVSVNTYGVNDLVAVVDSIAEARITDLVKEYADTYRVPAELRFAGERHVSLRYAARIELGLRDFLTGGGFGAFTTNFEDLGGLRQLPGLAVQRLMADGYGFGGEGDWKTSVLLRTLKVMGAGRPGGTSFMEDSSPAERSSSARTCWRSAPRSPSTRRPARSTRSASARARTRCAWSSTRHPGPPSSWVWWTSASVSGWWATRSTSSRRSSPCPGCRSPARSGRRGRACARPPRRG
jgi:hypothetical protein